MPLEACPPSVAVAAAALALAAAPSCALSPIASPAGAETITFVPVGENAHHPESFAAALDLLKLCGLLPLRLVAQTIEVGVSGAADSLCCLQEHRLGTDACGAAVV